MDGGRRLKTLPIDQVLPRLQECLVHHTKAVLIAEPGAGKSTRVPLALLEATWLKGRKILVLEPRRIAARSIARHMASSLGESVGRTVGYRVKHDVKSSSATRIEVITEGILTRMLQSDPSLEGVGAVLFDEFHERSLHTDLGLALCLQAQSLLREELRLLVMSATIDAEAVSTLLDDAPVVHSEGKVYPVETHYASTRPEGRLEQRVAAAIQKAMTEQKGDALVFLPGAGEIRRVQRELASVYRARDDIRVLPLYGAMSPEAQDEALMPTSGERRKVVLATSIAETSLTVEGIRIVIDSGWSREPRFSPRTGLTRLETVRVSRASADQRRGRAGRIAPGACYRLWTKEEERQLPAYRSPEIREADLSALALELAAWGVQDPSELAWLDTPPQAAYQQSIELLQRLEALDAAGKITEHGRRMVSLGTSPRLAQLLLRGAACGWSREASLLAALLQERDFMIVSGRDAASTDLRWRLEVLLAMQAGRKDSSKFDIDFVRAERILEDAASLLALLKSDPIPSEEPASLPLDRVCGVLLGFAYPDRIARKRGRGYLLRNGRGAAWSRPGEVLAADAEWIVAADLDDIGADSRIVRAAPLTTEDVEAYFGHEIERLAVTRWDEGSGSVRSTIQQKLGAILIREMPNPKPSEEEVLIAGLQGIVAGGIERLPWSKSTRQFQERNLWMLKYLEDWPDMRDEALKETIDAWLAPHLYGMKGRIDLQRIPLMTALESMLTWAQRQELDEQVPTHWTVPSGSRIPIDYSGASPALAVRLQEMFGATRTPTILQGRVPLTLHLLSPAQRPVQVTQDLTSFWQHAYFEVKKDLKGRYPKHVWPDDPTTASPTSRAKPRPK